MPTAAYRHILQIQGREKRARPRSTETLQLHRAGETAGKSHKKEQGTVGVGLRAGWWRDHLQGTGMSHSSSFYLLMLSFLALQTFPIIS